MGDKGGKKNKDKSQKQSSDKHMQKEKDKLEKQQKGQPIMEILSEKASKKNKTIKAINENMKVVEKSNK